MRFFFRCDDSPSIGSGHLLRMRALAESLDVPDKDIIFICRPLSETLRNQLTRFQVCEVPSESDDFYLDDTQELTILQNLEPSTNDWLVIDHYGYDKALLFKVCKLFRLVLLIDDYQPERVIPELTGLLNQSFSALSLPYPAYPKLRLLGPKYALLRKEFCHKKKDRRLKEFDGRLLLGFGASDTAKMTLAAINLLQEITYLLEITILVGWHNPNLVNIQTAVKKSRHNVTLIHGSEKMSELYLRHDLLLLSASMMSLEAASLGLPCGIFITEDNQRLGGLAMSSNGAAMLLGDIATFDANQAIEKINLLIHDQSVRQSLATQSQQQVNACGSELVAKSLLQRVVA
jgi:UDP-2,4-diacetamido-2,4,6-trideoxy-beta-L-altropyranose hydrolase